MSFRFGIRFAVPVLAMCMAVQAGFAQTETGGERGSVTNLPIPRFVSPERV